MARSSGVRTPLGCGGRNKQKLEEVLDNAAERLGTLTAVESFLSLKFGPEGSCLNDGTWQSAIYGLVDQGNLKKLRKQIGFKPLPFVGAKLKSRGAVFYSNEVNEYCIPFMGSDADVKRTQRYLNENLQETPVQYSAYAALGGICIQTDVRWNYLFPLYKM